MEVINRTILDMDMYLTNMERIAMKYLTYPSGVYYIEGNREPLTNSHYITHYLRKKKASKDPYHPIYAMYIMESAFYLYLRKRMTEGTVDNAEELIVSNPLTPGGVCIYDGLHNYTEYSDVVIKYIPNISNDDLNSMVIDIKKNLKWIEKVSSKAPYAIYNINSSGKNIVIEESLDIRAFRFQEAQVYQEILNECKEYDNHEY